MPNNEKQKLATSTAESSPPAHAARMPLMTPNKDSESASSAFIPLTPGLTAASKVSPLDMCELTVLLSGRPAILGRAATMPTEEVHVINVDRRATTVRRLLNLVHKAMNFVPLSRGVLRNGQGLPLDEGMTVSECGLDKNAVLYWVADDDGDADAAPETEEVRLERDIRAIKAAMFSSERAVAPQRKW